MAEPAGPDDAIRDVQQLSLGEWELLSSGQRALHPAIDRINAWAEDHPDVFAGVWLDNDAFLGRSGPVRIGVGVVQGARDEVRQSLLALVGDPELLLEVQDRIVAKYLGEGSRPARVTGVGIDVEANMLTVMLNQPDADFEARLRAEYEAVPVRIEYGEFRSLPLELDGA